MILLKTASCLLLAHLGAGNGCLITPPLPQLRRLVSHASIPPRDFVASMSPPAFLLVAATAACLFWALWRRQPSATAAKLDLPLVGFEGVDGLDENALKERYTKETGSLLKTGYNKVYAHISTGRLVFLLTDRPHDS